MRDFDLRTSIADHFFCLQRLDLGPRGGTKEVRGRGYPARPCQGGQERIIRNQSMIRWKSRECDGGETGKLVVMERRQHMPHASSGRQSCTCYSAFSWKTTSCNGSNHLDWLFTLFAYVLKLGWFPSHSTWRMPCHYDQVQLQLQLVISQHTQQKTHNSKHAQIKHRLNVRSEKSPLFPTPKAAPRTV